MTSQRAPFANNSSAVNPFVKWLLTDAWTVANPDDLVTHLAVLLIDSGIALRRLRIVIRTMHPLVFGQIFSWSRERGTTEVISPAHDVLDTTPYRDSPISAVMDEARTIRRRLDIVDPRLDFPYLRDLISEGATDYVAMPIVYSDGKVNVLTLVSEEPDGFRDVDLKKIHDMLPALARLMEAHTLRLFSKTLLATYLGKFTGERVLDGLIKRGDGEKIHAAIWFSDLRDSTPMAETMPISDFLALLDSFFDCMAGAVLDHGGEVLSFIGDAALAIFPISCESAPRKEACAPKEQACANALNAARNARNRMRQLNEQRKTNGQAPLGFGLALHVGDLMYGNVGVPERLQFTVIGAAVNHAARLQGLCKNLNRSILASSAFVGCAPDRWIPLGHHEMRGIRTPQEIFALSDD